MDCYTYLHYPSRYRSDPMENRKPERIVEKSVGDKISWSRVVALKHSKSKYKKQMVTDPFQITANRYRLLVNDSNDFEDTPANSSRPRKSTINYVRIDKKKSHKKSSVKIKVHKVLIVGGSQARRCEFEAKQQLNNEYKVFGVINP